MSRSRLNKTPKRNVHFQTGIKDRIFCKFSVKFLNRIHKPPTSTLSQAVECTIETVLSLNPRQVHFILSDKSSTFVLCLGVRVDLALSGATVRPGAATLRVSSLRAGLTSALSSAGDRRLVAHDQRSKGRSRTQSHRREMWRRHM